MGQKHFKPKRQRVAAIPHAASNRSHVTDNGRVNRALRIVGKFGSGHKDVGGDHDRELAVAFRT
jgi:hypothetical protein